MANIEDGLRNVISGMGGRFDKSSQSTYEIPHLDQAQILNSYRGSAIAKKIIDIPPFDACREWREWSGTPEQISTMQDEETRLDIRNKVRSAMTLARLYGGAAILIGTGDDNPEEPINVDRIQKGGLMYLTVLSCNYVSAGEINFNALDPGFGKPKYFQLNGSEESMVNVHPSRLAIFTGASIPDEFINMTGVGGAAWGDSILLAIKDDIKNLEATAKNIAGLVFEAKIDIVKIPELSMNLQVQGDEYEKNLIKKMEVVAQSKGNHGVIIMDSEEEYVQKKLTFATLPDVLDKFMILAAAAADIPATRLFGTSPAGMNATGDSDFRNYYDRLSAIQKLEIQPAMSILDACLKRSALGNNSDDVTFAWRPLWQVTDKEKAETGRLYAEIIEKISMLELISDEALADSLIAVLTGSEIMAGLAAAVEEYPVISSDPDDPDDPDEYEEL